MIYSQSFTRREFLKLGGLSLGAAASGLLGDFSPSAPLAQFPESERLGRVTEDFGRTVNLRARPNVDAPEVGTMAADEVFPWLREVVGYTPYRNQRWVETPNGYVWSPLVQSVRNDPNQPVDQLPGEGDARGMWVEVTVPYVDLILANPSPIGPRVSYLIENNLPYRLYYSQVIWVDDIRSTENGVEYHVRELHGSYGDHFWATAEAFRPVMPEDLAPISPEVENKSILVDLNRQTLSCFEEGREVYFCRISSGRFGEETETPTGDFLRVFWKLISVHMSAGSAAGAGYDLSGIGWPTFIATGGIAIHGTYWHNNFGERTSAGCVNARTEDAKFVSRWSTPNVPYYPGEVDAGGTTLGTDVRVIED